MKPHAGYGLQFSSFNNENVRLIVFLEFQVLILSFLFVLIFLWLD